METVQTPPANPDLCLFLAIFDFFVKYNQFDEVLTQTKIVLDELGVPEDNENGFGYIPGIFDHFWSIFR